MTACCCCYPEIQEDKKDQWQLSSNLRYTDAGDLALHAAPACHGEAAEDVVICRDVELGQGGASANNSEQ